MATAPVSWWRPENAGHLVAEEHDERTEHHEVGEWKLHGHEDPDVKGDRTSTKGQLDR